MSVGVDVLKGEVNDLKGSGIFEPAKVKKQALSSATETARLVLRIDDIISSRGGGGPPGGMPPGGMGGMGME
jgi:chaperonin GroEL (HSP60 family)